MTRPLLPALASRMPAGLLRRAGQWQLRSPAFRRLIGGAMRSVASADATISHGVGAGLRFNARGGNPGYALGITEPEVQRALADHLRAGATFYDVGAHRGFFTVIGARLVGATGRVYAFEPVAEAAGALRANVAANAFAHVEVREQAVSDAVGTAVLRVQPELAWAALVDRAQAAAPGDDVSVETVTIDAAVARGAQPPDVVKLDIEGAEPAALRGMSDTLREHGPAVICEFHDTFAECFEILATAGYATVDLQTGRTLAPADGADRHFCGLSQRTPHSTPTSGPEPGPESTS
jgi:FkbM family methyltransferase